MGIVSTAHRGKPKYVFCSGILELKPAVNLPRQVALYDVLARRARHHKKLFRARATGDLHPPLTSGTTNPVGPGYRLQCAVLSLSPSPGHANLYDLLWLSVSYRTLRALWALADASSAWRHPSQGRSQLYVDRERVDGQYVVLRAGSAIEHEDASSTRRDPAGYHEH
jgi:hypothetical protein